MSSLCYLLGSSLTGSVPTWKYISFRKPYFVSEGTRQAFSSLKHHRFFLVVIGSWNFHLRTYEPSIFSIFEFGARKVYDEKEKVL